MPISEVYNIDCVEYMRTLPDNAFELAIVDPPYGDALNTDYCLPPHTQARGYTRFGHRFDRYKPQLPTSKSATYGAAGSRGTRIHTSGGRQQRKYYFP